MLEGAVPGVDEEASVAGREIGDERRRGPSERQAIGLSEERSEEALAALRIRDDGKVTEADHRGRTLAIVIDVREADAIDAGGNASLEGSTHEARHVQRERVEVHCVRPRMTTAG